MELVNEIWKRVDWAKHEVFISNKGNVIRKYPEKSRTAFGEKHIISPERIKSLSVGKVQGKYNAGYLTVSIQDKDGKIKSAYIHRLLAEAFIPNADNKPQVNHIDGNSLNNSLDNLEWATAKENINHAWGMGLCKKNRIRLSNVEIIKLRDFLKNKTGFNASIIIGVDRQVLASTLIRGSGAEKTVNKIREYFQNN